MSLMSLMRVMGNNTNRSNEANKTHGSHGGYESLIVYWLAIDIFDLTSKFCSKFIDKKSRTFDQMIQAARSGKQNIVEGSLENSIESNLKLTGVARASYGELLEDYRDFLRQNNMEIWQKTDARVVVIRKMRINTNRSNETNGTYETYLGNPEGFANLLITLCFKQGFLLDQLIKSINNRFIREGGFRENLFKKRIKFRSV